jgi:hypothetical protein
VTRSRGTAVATALLLAALAAAGCGLGAGAGIGGIGLTVTREFGAAPVLERTVDANESDTAMRLLEGNAEISTRYGGGYVQSIEGVEEAQRGGRPYDWFFFVDGIESPIGAADYSLHGSERIWWDYRDWSATNHVPAVVGSWPAPFVDGYEGESHPVVVACEGGGGACTQVRRALGDAGVPIAGGSPSGAIRLLVGPWARLRSDPAAALIEGGPGESGVYANFERQGRGYRLVGLDPAGESRHDFGPAAGLVAATRRYEAPPTWVVTGATPAAVQAAAGLLAATKLRDHYAVATENGKETPLPVEVPR